MSQPLYVLRVRHHGKWRTEAIGKTRVEVMRALRRYRFTLPSQVIAHDAWEVTRL